MEEDVKQDEFVKQDAKKFTGKSKIYKIKLDLYSTNPNVDVIIHKNMYITAVDIPEDVNENSLRKGIYSEVINTINNKKFIECFEEDDDKNTPELVNVDRLDQINIVSIAEVTNK